MHAATNGSQNYYPTAFDHGRDAYAIRPADHQTLKQGQGHTAYGRRTQPIEQNRRYKRHDGPSTQSPWDPYYNSTMSSYGSNKSGHVPPQYQQAPPYPTTPGPPSQPQNYFHPIPEQQPVYSSSPNQSTSPYATMPEPNVGRRRTSSSSSYNPPSHAQPQPQSMPMPIRQPDPHQYQHPAASYPPPVSYAQQAPVYTRSMSQQSHYSQHGEHAHHPHAYADGEDKYEHHHHGHHHGGLDPETEKEYKRRYAKDKEFERRPTLGGSLLSMVDKVGKAFGSERH